MILDTTFLIDVMKNKEEAIAIRQKMEEEREAYRISIATIFELWAGIAASKKSEVERMKVLDVLSDIDVVDLTRPIAEKAGEIHGILIKNGEGIDNIDAMITATALLENEAVLTRNIKHFTRVKGLKVETY